MAVVSAGPEQQQQIPQIQRARLLAGAVGAIEEHGYARTTVSHITARARISRRTFYELFENRDACVVALIDETVAALETQIAAAELGGEPWRERVRGGLQIILAHLDREPALARVCVVQALRGGAPVLAVRERVLARLAAVLDEGRAQGTAGADCTPLVAEGLVGAIFGIVYARLARRERAPLTDLLGQLMGLIALPYLGAAAARRERARNTPPLPPAELGRADRGSGDGVVDPLGGVQMRLTYRTMRVLEGVAEHPGASNRAAGERAGIADPGQVSKLLARLQRLGLLANDGARVKGEPNAWTLTAKGALVAENIRAHAPTQTAVGNTTNASAAGGRAPSAGVGKKHPSRREGRRSPAYTEGRKSL
ncbi:MAG TPA: TetR/AcrR family transcriptional regulator [Solirubrobacteraceae bacterium]|nr:TetR/AcrR family transcriptional regulator [Solirubrobacteraceae bacterium]